MSPGCALAGASTAHFTTRCLGLPATSPQANTSGKSGTSGPRGRCHWSPHRAHAGGGAAAAATFLLGESQDLRTYLQAKFGARKEGNATRSLHPRRGEGCTHIHGQDAQKQHVPGYWEHRCTHAQTRTAMAATTAPFSEQQLIPSSFLPPHRLAPAHHQGVGRFSATNTEAGPAPRAQAQPSWDCLASSPALPTQPSHVCSSVSAGCYNISPQTSQQLWPCVICLYRIHPTVRLSPWPSCKR